jgi:hypothetical protein
MSRSGGKAFKEWMNLFSSYWKIKEEMPTFSKLHDQRRKR